MSFKIEHEYEGIKPHVETVMMPSLLQGPTYKSNQWEPISISIVDEIDTDTATMVANSLRKAEETGQTIVPMFIESVGGSVYALMCIIESMRRCRVPIYTFTSGQAASCAACIFCSGKRRFMTRHARLLIHDVSVDFSSETSMTSSNIKIEAKEMRILNKTIFQIIAENTGHAPNFFVNLIRTKRNNDIYVDAKQALEWNLATDIGYPIIKVRHSLNMDVEVMPETNDFTKKDKAVSDDESDSDSDEDTLKESDPEPEPEEVEEVEEVEVDHTVEISAPKKRRLEHKKKQKRRQKTQK